jgi:hypothetical protein
MAVTVLGKKFNITALFQRIKNANVFLDLQQQSTIINLFYGHETWLKQHNEFQKSRIYPYNNLSPVM